MGYKGSIIFPLIRKSRVIVDIGAKNGKEAKRFLKMSPKSKIYIFEPLPRWFNHINKSFRKKSNCFVYNYAISDKDGEADFNVSLGGSQNSSSLKKPTKLHSARFGKKPIKVKTCKLDTWYQETGLKTIDFIWSDVEGNERELINGGNNALKNTKYFYTEYTEKEYLKGQALIPEIIGLVSELGFEKVEVFPWFNKKEGKLWHFGDILFRNTSFGD